MIRQWNMHNNKQRGEEEGGKWVLTGECASETTRPFSHCGVAVGSRGYRRKLGDWSTVHFRKLKDHFGGSSSSPLFASLLQGSNLLKGATLGGWGLRVGRRRLGLVTTWRAARTWTGTAAWAGVQDDTTWGSREEVKTQFPDLYLGHCSHAQCRWECERWAMLHFDAESLLGRRSQTNTKPFWDGRKLIWWI